MHFDEICLFGDGFFNAPHEQKNYLRKARLLSGSPLLLELLQLTTESFPRSPSLDDRFLHAFRFYRDGFLKTPHVNKFFKRQKYSARFLNGFPFMLPLQIKKTIQCFFSFSAKLRSPFYRIVGLVTPLPSFIGQDSNP